MQTLLLCYLQGQIYGTFIENQCPVLIKEFNRKDAFYFLAFDLNAARILPVGKGASAIF